MFYSFHSQIRLFLITEKVKNMYQTESVIELCDRLSEKNSSQFIGLTYTSKTGLITPQTARYVINTNVNLKRVYAEDIKTLKAHLETLTTDLEIQVCNELIKSLETSLERGIGNNPNFTRKNHVKRIDGTLRKVIRRDNTEGIEILGLIRSKVVLIKGEYKKVNSRPKTLVKNKMKKDLDLGTSKIRSLSVNLDTIKGIRHNGDVIELCDEVMIAKVKKASTKVSTKSTSDLVTV